MTRNNPIASVFRDDVARPVGLLRSRHRQAGSLLVLVVVCLVLMALIGTAYIQVARIDRFATADSTPRHIDQVAAATINYIGQVLRNDIVDNNDQFFMPPSGTPYADGTGNEAYDYPWTNGNAAYVDAWQVRLDDGTVATADGGINDDTWLAATMPTFSNANDGAWSHITNLMGTYLLLPDAGSAHTIPVEQPSKVNLGGSAGQNILQNDSNLDLGELFDTAIITAAHGAGYQTAGADADMDGIPDAKWQWAPLRQVGSTKYVMAVRIIDNSALINLNVATVLTKQDLDPDPDLPTNARGYFPAEIDLSRLVRRVVPTPTLGWEREIRGNVGPALLRGRGMTVQVPFPVALGLPSTAFDSNGRINWSVLSPPILTPPEYNTIAGQWYNNTLRWRDNANKISMAGEFELRWRGGVNNPRSEVDIENAMPALMRRDAASEIAYDDVAPSRMAFFQGHDTSDDNNPMAAVADRVFPSLRNQTTTRSGAAVFASNAGNLHSGQYTRKYDLVNHEDISSGAPRINALRERIERVFRVANGANQGYLGLNVSDPDLQDAALEYALAIVDYSDPDREPSSATGVGNTNRTYYALETLPFFREGYMQAAYRNRDLYDAVSNPVPDGISDTWEYATDSFALAVEIANPFDKPIDFDDGPRIRLRIAGQTTGTDENTFELTNALAGGVMGPRTATGNSTLIFYANAVNTHPEGTDATPRGDLVADLSLPVSAIALLPVGTGPVIPHGEPIIFELQVQTAGGDWVTYDRLGPKSSEPLQNQMTFDAQYPHADGAVLAPDPDIDLYHYRTYSMRRPSSNGGVQGIHFISNHGSQRDFVSQAVGRNAFPAPTARFNEEIKNTTVDGDVTLNGYQIPIANRQFLSVAELGWIHMFGFYTNGTSPSDNEQGDFPSRMALAASSPEAWVLDINGPVANSDVGMNHAALLFEQFTTLSPMADGLDNDGNGINDSPKEQFVPGLININTAPLHLLTLAAPLNEGIDDIQALMQSIIEYRDNLAVRSNYTPIGNPRPDAKGIASIGELALLKNTAGLPSPLQRIDMYTQFVDDDDYTLTEKNVYPTPEDQALHGAVRNIHTSNDGPERQLARFSFLSQVFNTRSDIFTAHVRLRGYPANGFNQGEVESMDFIVVFDRSNITGPNDQPRVLGVYVYP